MEQESFCAVGGARKRACAKEGEPMKIGWKVPVLVLATAAAAAPAPAQDNTITGVPTETQRRMAEGDVDIPWGDLIGLVGLVGLLGLRKRHPEDGYHPTVVE
jgi:hypothetical protein